MFTQLVDFMQRPFGIWAQPTRGRSSDVDKHACHGQLRLERAGSAFPIWSDTRNTDLFLCPGTGKPSTPPALCGATETNGLKANDEETFTSTVDVPTGDEQHHHH